MGIFNDEYENRIAQLESELIAFVAVFDPEIKTIGRARSWLKQFLKNPHGTERFDVYQWGIRTFEK